MDRDTFRSRVVKLIQKSKKALRLYTSMSRLNTGEASELADKQLDEWKSVNQILIRTLTENLERLGNKELTERVFYLRNYFYSNWRAAEAEMKSKLDSLSSAASNEDFIKCAGLSRDLAVLKSKTQASQAACHELQTIIDQNKLSTPVIDQDKMPELEEDSVAEPMMAKVIPLWGR
ncbi:MAG: hypothetical protein KDD56_07405 [Bdellovibrionales bacterium]|nr:hypothetical protein [Bdellovibrionales bacterium]